MISVNRIKNATVLGADCRLTIIGHVRGWTRNGILEISRKRRALIVHQNTADIGSLRPRRFTVTHRCSRCFTDSFAFRTAHHRSPQTAGNGRFPRGDLGFLLGAVQTDQDNGHQNAHNGNDDQKFDQGEA